MKRLSILFSFLLVLFSCDPCGDMDCNHGNCVNGECQCTDGWTGDNCDIDPCSGITCIHGTCVNGICQCTGVWGGTYCDECTLNCNDHGDCNEYGICVCDDGWDGDNCETQETVSYCNNTCTYADDEVCDDGGPESEYFECDCGTDCNDCGTRYESDCSDEVDGYLGVYIAIATNPCNTSKINIWVDPASPSDPVDGSITTYFATEPSCGDAGVFTIGLSEGTHNLYAECDDGLNYWSGAVYVYNGMCTIIGLTEEKSFFQKRKFLRKN